MNFQSIENYITQFPIYQYTFLSIDDIDFNDKVLIPAGAFFSYLALERLNKLSE